MIPYVNAENAPPRFSGCRSLRCWRSKRLAFLQLTEASPFISVPGPCSLRMFIDSGHLNPLPSAPLPHRQSPNMTNPVSQSADPASPERNCQDHRRLQDSVTMKHQEMQYLTLLHIIEMSRSGKIGAFTSLFYEQSHSTGPCRILHTILTKTVTLDSSKF
jgi:hypothetical protein